MHLFNLIFTLASLASAASSNFRHLFISTFRHHHINSTTFNVIISTIILNDAVSISSVISSRHVVSDRRRIVRQRRSRVLERRQDLDVR